MIIQIILLLIAIIVFMWSGGSLLIDLVKWVKSPVTRAKILFIRKRLTDYIRRINHG